MKYPIGIQTFGDQVFQSAGLFIKKLKRGYTIDAPVVTDDKVYQFIREMRELRVYENVPI